MLQQALLWISPINIILKVINFVKLLYYLSGLCYFMGLLFVLLIYYYYYFYMKPDFYLKYSYGLILRSII